MAESIEELRDRGEEGERSEISPSLEGGRRSLLMRSVLSVSMASNNGWMWLAAAQVSGMFLVESKAYSENGARTCSHIDCGLLVDREVPFEARATQVCVPDRKPFSADMATFSVYSTNW